MMIEIKNISKQFGKLQVLNDVNTSFQAGQCIALIGPNGSGKTTLIKSILRMVIPDKGSISFAGKDIGTDWTYRARIGYMPQTGRYPDAATIGQVISMMKDIRSEVPELDEDLVKTFGLRTLYSKRTGNLSGGTRQKLSAALAFLFSPDVLILDEPTAGLDPLSSEKLKEKIIQEKDSGKLILITSHILSDLDDLVTEVAYMQEGLLCFHKSLQMLRAETGETRLQRAIATIMQDQSPTRP
jgi:Cu-processing system ATP-binding protein